MYCKKIEIITYLSFIYIYIYYTIKKMNLKNESTDISSNNISSQLDTLYNTNETSLLPFKKDENKDEEDESNSMKFDSNKNMTKLIQTSAKKKSVIPISFPKPKQNVFLKYYAPNEPIYLLPCNFKIYLMDLETICETIQSDLKKCNNLTFSTSGSSWHGSFLNTSCHCEFRCCVYKSKDDANVFIIEFQKIEGDGFIFGNFYNRIKKLFEPKKSDNLIDTSNKKVEDNNIEECDNNPITTKNDLQLYINFIKNTEEMISSEDFNVSLNGIQFAGELATDPIFSEHIFNSRLIEILINVLYQRHESCRNRNRNNWKIQHSLCILAYFAENNSENFNTYINSRLVGEETLLTRLQTEIDKITEEMIELYSDFIHNIQSKKYIDILKEKINTIL